MNEKRIGIIMNGVTGRMGTNQHLVRSVLAIMKEYGLERGKNAFRKQEYPAAVEDLNRYMALNPPEDDAIEQNTELVPDEVVFAARQATGLEVNEADAAEQERSAGYDDDDYR